MRRAFNLNIAPARNAPPPSGIRSLSSLMKVALLSLEITSHSHFDAENLFRQFNLHVLLHRHLTGQTATGFGIPLGNMRLGRQDIPPPSLTVTRHWPQEPPPPQAEETKIPLLDSVFSSLSPAGCGSVYPLRYL